MTVLAGDPIYAGDIPTRLGTASSGTNTSTISSSTPTIPSTQVGFSFTAPRSGEVLITATMIVSASASANNSAGGFFVRTGSTIGSGTTVYDPSVEPSCKLAQNGFSGALSGTICDVVTGLTAGSLYNVVIVGFTGAGTMSFFNQKLTVISLG